MIRAIIQTVACFAGTTSIASRADGTFTSTRLKLRGGGPEGIACWFTDTDAWAMLNGNVSRPFERPKSGRMAVKLFNHRGDELIKIFRAESA